MCRWIAYRGETIPLEQYVTAPAHSLVVQSQRALESTAATNGDGFGMGWYGHHSEPGLYREVRPAWSDENLRYLCRHIRSHLYFAHVRASTGTPITRPNCHPFACGRWLRFAASSTGVENGAGPPGSPVSTPAGSMARPDAYVSRTYRGPEGRQALLFAQFHGTNRWGAHQPEVDGCGGARGIGGARGPVQRGPGQRRARAEGGDARHPHRTRKPGRQGQRQGRARRRVHPGG